MSSSWLQGQLKERQAPLNSGLGAEKGSRGPCPAQTALQTISDAQGRQSCPLQDRSALTRDRLYSSVPEGGTWGRLLKRATGLPCHTNASSPGMGSCNMHTHQADGS